MSPRQITRVFNCEVCGKHTTRLLGVGVGLITHEASAASLRSAVLGYCAAHREDALPRFVDGLAQSGTVEWVSDPPVQLRPADVDDFIATLDSTVLGASAAPGHLGTHSTPQLDAVDLDNPPQECPHCGGQLSWGTGPHVADAALRPAAKAWECPSCHAAGLLTAGR